MKGNYDPLAKRAYLLLQLSEAQNECEITACEVALRVLERSQSIDNHYVSWLERSQSNEN